MKLVDGEVLQPTPLHKVRISMMFCPVPATAEILGVPSPQALQVVPPSVDDLYSRSQVPMPPPVWAGDTRVRLVPGQTPEAVEGEAVAVGADGWAETTTCSVAQVVLLQVPS